MKITEIGFRVHFDLPADIFEANPFLPDELRDKPLNEDDVEICIQLPDGRTECQYITKERLNQAGRITLEVVDSRMYTWL